MTEVIRPLITDLAKIMMFTETPGVQGQRSKLTWSVRDGNPRVSVFTNDPKDTIGKGIIYCPMNPETFYSVLQLMETVIRGADGVMYKVDCLTAARDAQRNIIKGEKTALSEFYFGKDDNGMFWISCVAANRPKIKFIFRVSEYHKIYKNGVPLTESEASCIQAMATINILKAAFAPLVGVLKQPGSVATNVEKPVAVARNVPSEFADDIPF